MTLMYDPNVTPELGSLAERYWGMTQWRLAVKTATALLASGITPRMYMPKRAALRPAFRYFRVIETGEEFAVLESEADQWQGALLKEMQESDFTNDQLASMESICCQSAVARSGL